MHLDDGAASDALTAIITLSRMAEVHLTGIDEEYRFYYFKQTNGPRSSRTKLNIDFVTHWQVCRTCASIACFYSLID